MIKIAIDGLSGSGKGALADGLAKIYNLKHLDTGAIFRTMGLAFLNQNILDPKEDDIKSILNSITVEVVFDNSQQSMILNGENVTKFLRQEEISKLASKVSTFDYAREKYLKIVNDFSNKYDCVIDGRDITSIVMPDADVKFYLTADEKTRAERRFKENQEKHIETTFDEVLSNLQERDYRDTHRDIAPLIIVDDAFVVDNTNLNIQQTIEKCSEIINKKLKK